MINIPDRFTAVAFQLCEIFGSANSRLHLMYPLIIETVKDWADCEQLTPIEVGQICIKI